MTFFYDLNKRLNALAQPKPAQLNEGKGDGNLANNAKPYDKVTRGDVIAGRLGKDEMGGKHKDAKSKFKKTNEAKKPDANKDGIPDYAQDGKGANDLGKGKKPAAQDKKSGAKQAFQKQMGGSAADLTKGLSVKKKSAVKESTFEGIDYILSKYPREVEVFKQGGELDYDLESDLWDYYFNRGDIRNYDADASEYIAQRLADELGLNEDAGSEFTAADWKKVVGLKRKLMQADPSREPEDAEQEAVEILGYDYDKVLAWLDSDENLEEADYSAKKARAGKDIGKPGKNFEKIAKSAGERYGSKERGEKVAGAVLAKLRGKNESVEEAVKEIPGGRRHTAEPGGYGRKDDEEAPKAVTKKGRGRPKKGSDSETGEVMKPDWSAFGVGKVKLPKHTGAVTKHKMVGEGEDGDVEAAIKMLKKAGYTVSKDKKQVDEKVKSPYAVGMAQAMKSTGDKPPLKKSTIKKAHDIAKKVDEEDTDTKPQKKKKEVDETTVAGSVAPAASTPKSAKGMTFGKGIYDSWNRELEGMIAESINVSVNMSTGGATGAPTKNLTVSADGDDAERLSELLLMAGLNHSTPAAEGSGCGTRQMDENAPDWPTNTEYSDDAFQYSGGLNKPKSTGQTTAPIIASQVQRQDTDEEIEENYDPYFDPESRESQKYKEPRDDVDPDSDYPDDLDEIRVMKQRAGISDGKYTQDYFTANTPSAERQRAEADREHRPNTPFSRDPIEATTDRAVDQLSKMFKMFKKK